MTDSVDRLYERVLVLRCQTGDESAFTELVARYQPRLRCYLRKLLRDTTAAEDALQEVWLDVLRAVARLADAGAFRAWLYRVARDRALRELRKRRPPCRPLPEAELTGAAGGGPDPAADDVARVHAAIAGLAAEHREVVVLRYVENMTYEEIAQVVGCPVGTVRSRLHYAKQALRGALERTDVHD
jgi:RNA polymerase sigma-70 factor (ECF subfamily)